MVRSEDEIQRYDIFKISVLIVLAASTALAYAKAKKAEGLKNTEMALSMVEPSAQDAVIDKDTQRFNGSGPGVTVDLVTAPPGARSIGHSKVVNYGWDMEVSTKHLIDTEVTLIARDANGKEVGSVGPMRFNIPDDVRARLKGKAELLPDAPVEITKPANGEQVADSTVAFFGTGVPDTSVKVYLKRLDLPSGLKSSGEQIDNPTVDASGEWQFVKTFSPGSYRVTAKTRSHSSTVEFTVMKTTGGFTEN